MAEELLHVGQSLVGEDVVAVMQRLHQQLSLGPERIQVDNGSEFISKDLGRFLALTDAQEKIECRRQEYNGFRPHSWLQNLTPD